MHGIIAWEGIRDYLTTVMYYELFIVISYSYLHFPQLVKKISIILISLLIFEKGNLSFHNDLCGDVMNNCR